MCWWTFGFSLKWPFEELQFWALLDFIFNPWRVATCFCLSVGSNNELQVYTNLMHWVWYVNFPKSLPSIILGHVITNLTSALANIHQNMKDSPSGRSVAFPLLIDVQFFYQCSLLILMAPKLLISTKCINAPVSETAWWVPSAHDLWIKSSGVSKTGG